MLDALSIKDSIELHEIATSSVSVAKYNAIQRATKAGLETEDPERLVLGMREVEELEHSLRREYEAAIDQELPAHHRKLRRQRDATFIHALASLLLTPVGLATGIWDVVMSGLRTLGQKGLAVAIDERVRSGLEALERFAGSTGGGDSPILLSFADALKAEYVGKLSGDAY